MFKVLHFTVIFIVSCFSLTKAQNCGNGQGTCQSNLQQTNGPTIYTPNGSAVNTFIPTGPLAMCEINAGDAQLNAISGVTSLSCPSSAYNCHGYAWHAQFNGYGQQTWIVI